MKTGGELEIIPLGAGCEIGRSCIIVKYQNRSVMLDCGIHPAHSGIGALPIFDAIDVENIDLCLVTHFHLDHCGAVPYFVCKTAFKGKLFMTEPTLTICRLLWSDYANVSSSNWWDASDSLSPTNEDKFLFDQDDLEKTLDRCETIDFNQELEWNGIKFTCYSAGHVLGACMFLVEINGVRFLYTGDYSREIDRHIPSAVIPPVDVHVLICEATYGVRVHDERKLREKRFLNSIKQIIERNGKCLLPVFALGRAQELLFILEEFWEQNPELHQIPLISISSMSDKSLTIYETFVSMCGDYIKQIAQKGRNPFYFQFVQNIKNFEKAKQFIHQEGPCVIMAAPGMLQNGISKDIFEAWAPDSRNGVILTGYTVKGTLADELKNEPDIIKLADRQIKRKCTFEQISFSAHADFVQTQEFIEKLRAPNVVLVHGEKGEMNKLKERLQIERPALSVFTPEMLQKISLQFSSDNCIRVVGSLADDLSAYFKTFKNAQIADNCYQEIEKQNPEIHLPVEAVIINDMENTPKMLYPVDIREYTSLEPTYINQSLRLKFSGSIETLYDNLSGIFDKIERKSLNHIALHNQIHIEFNPSNKDLIITWMSSPMTDLVADSVTFIILNSDFNETQFIERPGHKGNYENILLSFLKHEFNEIEVMSVPYKSEDHCDEHVIHNANNSNKRIVKVTVRDAQTSKWILVEIDLDNRTASCCSAPVQEKFVDILKKVERYLNPISLPI